MITLRILRHKYMKEMQTFNLGAQNSLNLGTSNSKLELIKENDNLMLLLGLLEQKFLFEIIQLRLIIY